MIQRRSCSLHSPIHYCKNPGSCRSGSVHQSAFSEWPLRLPAQIEPPLLPPRSKKMLLSCHVSRLNYHKNPDHIITQINNLIIFFNICHMVVYVKSEVQKKSPSR